MFQIIIEDIKSKHVMKIKIISNHYIDLMLANNHTYYVKV